VSAYPPGAGVDVTQWEFSGGQKVFGRYTLVKILGQGGMGVVWLARDEELEREVALKFLPDPIVHDRALLNDLKNETRRSLELTHKNIVRIYDFVHGERAACISMEYVDGETLSNLRAEKERKVFEPDELAPWTSQLCDALDYAHNHARIIHRDLKPANLMVNKKGDLKVTDFGIARSLGDTVSRLTKEQGRSGTLVYMSPQQLAGEHGTHLDDIYSLGATLYDLLTSKPPFYSGNIDRQIHERVPPSMSERRKDLNIEPASVPPIWEEVVAACLQKDPAKRPQSAMEVANRLQLSSVLIRAKIKGPPKPVVWVGVAVLLCLIGLGGWYFAKSKLPTKTAAAATNALTQAAAIPDQSVAVLPFENLSADPNNAFLSIGIQDEILTRLAKISALKVISRSSTRQYESRPANLPQVAKELGVAAILEGSVQKVGETIRVNVQLVKAATDTHLWAETYDRKLIDVLRVESDVATAVAAQLRATLTPEETARINVTPTNNPDAYEEYLQGREMRIAPASYLPEYDAKQRQHYERAITIDPEFALAHAALSYWYSINGMSGGVTPENKMKARAEADEALRLQPDLGEAHLALGTYYYLAERNYDAADKEFAIALRALPNDAELFMIRSLMERRRNHWRTAIAGLQHAVSLDPRNVRTITWLGHIYSAVHDYAAAEQTRRREVDVASAVSPENAVYSKNGLCYLQWIRTGNIAPMQSLFDQLPQDFDPGLRGLVLSNIGFIKRDPDIALRSLEISGDKQDLSQLFFGAVPLLVKGDTSHANEILDGLISQYERRVRENPAEAQFHSHLGLFCAYRGRKEEAIREGRRAVELLPESKDAAVGPDLESFLAKIYARVGEPELAIDLIEHLLTVPCEEDATMTKRELQVDWSWDPLRQNPRFQKMLSSPEPKLIYN